MIIICSNLELSDTSFGKGTHPENKTKNTTQNDLIARLSTNAS